MEEETIGYANRLHLRGERKEIKGSSSNHNLVDGILLTKTEV